jgi:acetate kinase
MKLITGHGNIRINELQPSRRNEAPVLFISQCVQAGLLDGMQDIKSILFRVVAPSSYFASHKKLTKASIARLRSLEVLAVSHIRPVLEDIEEMQKVFENREMYSISDSAFHRTMPEIARTFSIDPEFAVTHDVYRFGYHGLSVEGIVHFLQERGNPPSRLLVVHVGGGSSVTAVLDGLSMETSMGFMPLTGSPMATRAHDLDVGGFVQILLHSGESTEKILKRLYHDSGLVNYANIGHGGMREILIAAKVGNHAAALALSKYSYHMRKEIAAQIAVLGGIDMIVLTGTAMERSARLRTLTLDGLRHLGVLLDESKNAEVNAGEGIVSKEGTGPIVEVIETKEMNQMAEIGQNLS